MNLTATRKQLRADGIFSEITDESGNVIAVTLEHAYDNGNGKYLPKVSDGEYVCQRGTHALHNGVPFVTFEVTGVAGHQGILFHVGNVNGDSEGCFLVGSETFDTGSKQVILDSRKTFAKFMTIQDGIDQFKLKVITPAGI